MVIRITLRLGLGLCLSFNVTHIRTVLRLGCGWVIVHNTWSVLRGVHLIKWDRLLSGGGGVRSNDCPSSCYCYWKRWKEKYGKRQWWSRDFFWDRGYETRDEPRHFGFGRDETRLKHSENVRGLRHCRDTVVKKWDKPKQFNFNLKSFCWSTVNK